MQAATDQLISQFKALADPVRLRLVALCAHGECSVSELTEIMGLSQPRVSQHLKQLCDCGLVERFRDGHFVYYRVPTRGKSGGDLRRFVGLLPEGEPIFDRDIEALRDLRGATGVVESSDDNRPLHRALVELTVSTPLGDLLDIGCGQGRLMKLLASRANRAVGVDIDADARRFARAHLLLAGLPNCTFRHGDMYSLPLEDQQFDTIIVDDVLGDANDPVKVLQEATRPLRDGGRLLILCSSSANGAEALSAKIAGWCRAANLRLAPPRAVPAKDPRWLLAVATPAEAGKEAA